MTIIHSLDYASLDYRQSIVKTYIPYRHTRVMTMSMIRLPLVVTLRYQYYVHAGYDKESSVRPKGERSLRNKYPISASELLSDSYQPRSISCTTISDSVIGLCKI